MSKDTGSEILHLLSNRNIEELRSLLKNVGETFIGGNDDMESRVSVVSKALSDACEMSRLN